MTGPSDPFWDERYAAGEYAYGTEPSLFLKECLASLPPGRALFPAEGEGRNAVYAAQCGWEVSAFDGSAEGRRKALALAAVRGVTLDYRLMRFDDMDYPDGSFDLIALIFVHPPPEERRALHRRVVSMLRPGGRVLLEVFSTEQLRFSSGGPKDPEMLHTPERLRREFSGLRELRCTVETVRLDEGPFHHGEASVLRAEFVRER